jgi:hypothetical protein
LKKWITLNSRNTSSTTNLEEEEIVDAPGNDGKTSVPGKVKRPNPWRKVMMIMNNKHTTCLITMVITVLQCVIKPFYKGRIRLYFFL